MQGPSCLTFKCYNRPIHLNTKTNNTLLKLVNNEFAVLIRLRQHMQVQCPLKLIVKRCDTVNSKKV